MEVAATKSTDWGGAQRCRQGIVLAMALIIEKEKRFVALFVQARNVHWTANREPELVAVRIRFWRVVDSIKERVGVELAVSQVLVRVSVYSACSRFCNNVNDVPGTPAVLRGK